MSQQTHKITNIQPQKRHKNRFTITLESGDVFGISEDVFISERLSIGKLISKEDLSLIIENETKQKIKSKALTLLSYRQRSRAELYKRLNEKFQNETTIHQVLDELTQKGYLDDYQFAKMMMTHLIVQKKLGQRAVLNEMRTHQINPNALEEILEKILEEHSPKNTIEKIVEKRMQNKKSSLKEKQKLINFLTRKGFFWDDIEPIIQKISWTKT